jgi:hypothetical protein
MEGFPSEEDGFVRLVALILRFYSLLFHLLLSFLMAGVGGLAWLSGQHNLQIWLLPWQGTTLTYWLLGAGAAGLAITLLAWKRIMPLLFLAWSVVVFVMLVRGYFFGSYHFGLGSTPITTALLIVLLALLAVAGAWFQFRSGKYRKAIY